MTIAEITSAREQARAAIGAVMLRAKIAGIDREREILARELRKLQTLETFANAAGSELRTPNFEPIEDVDEPPAAVDRDTVEPSAARASAPRGPRASHRDKRDAQVRDFLALKGPSKIVAVAAGLKVSEQGARNILQSCAARGICLTAKDGAAVVYGLADQHRMTMVVIAAKHAAPAAPLGSGRPPDQDRIDKVLETIDRVGPQNISGLAALLDCNRINAGIWLKRLLRRSPGVLERTQIGPSVFAHRPGQSLEHLAAQQQQQRGGRRALSSAGRLAVEQRDVDAGAHDIDAIPEATRPRQRAARSFVDKADKLRPQRERAVMQALAIEDASTGQLAELADCTIREMFQILHTLAGQKKIRRTENLKAWSTTQQAAEDVEVAWSGTKDRHGETFALSSGSLTGSSLGGGEYISRGSHK